jgi:O-antigen/teichoic acid export membrane protein
MSRTDQVLHSPLDGTTFEEPERAETVSPRLGPASGMRNSGTAIAGGLVSQALKAVVMIYVARVFGASEFGSFSFANSVNAFLFVIAQFGLPVFGAREVAQTGRLKKDLLKAITEARLLLAGAGTLVALVVLYFVPGVTRTEFWLVAGFGLSNVALSGFGDWAFQGMGRLHLWAALNIVWQGLWLILSVTAVHARASIVFLSFGYAVAAFVTVFISWPWLRRLTRQPNESAPVRSYSVRSVIGAGANLGAATMLITVLVWTDTIIVRWLQGQHAAGLYAAGNRVALALAMLASFYVVGAFPMLSHSAMSSPSEYSRCFQRAFEDMALLFIPGALWALFYAPQIMLVLFNNPEYLAAATVFRIFQVFLLVNVICNLYGMGGLVAHHRDHAYRRAMGTSAVALLVLCPILTLRWGMVGAALAAVFSQSLNLVLFVVEARDVVRPEFLKTLGVPALMAVIPVLSGTVFHLRFWASVVALALTYLAIFIWRRPVLYPVIK